MFQPFLLGELVWHLSTQVNDSDIAAYIIVFDPRRGKALSRPRFLLGSHSLLCIKNHLFIAGIGPTINKELKFIFRSDQYDRTCVYI